MISIDRIKEEIDILKNIYDGIMVSENHDWVMLPVKNLQDGWSLSRNIVAFEIPVGYPGTPPYGIYVPSDITFNGSKPANFKDNINKIPPFEGSWGLISWQPEPSEWKPNAKITAGSNLFHWVQSIKTRFDLGV